MLFSRIFLFLAVLLANAGYVSTSAFAYDPGAFNTAGAGAPTGVCPTNGQEYVDTQTTNVWNCQAGTWTQATRQFGQTMQVGNQVGFSYAGTPATKSYAATVSSGSTSVTISGAYFIYPGMTVTDSQGCFPAGTTIAYGGLPSVNGPMTISQAATTPCAAGGTADTITAYYNWIFDYLPVINETGQTITDLKICYPGGNGYGVSGVTPEGEFAANPLIIQSAVEYPLILAYTNIPTSNTFQGYGTTATITPGGLMCSDNTGLEIPAGALYVIRSLVQTATNPSTQLLPLNRTGLNFGAFSLVGGGTYLPTIGGPQPLREAATTAATATGSSSLSFVAAPPGVISGMYVGSATAQSSIVSGTKVSVTPTTGTVNITNAIVTTAYPTATTTTFTSYQPFLYPSASTGSGSSTLPFAACPVGVGPGFILSTNAAAATAPPAGISLYTTVVSCSAGVMTISQPTTATIPTTEQISFVPQNSAETSQFNPVSIQANVQLRGLSILNAGDSETGNNSGPPITLTTSGSSTCSGGQATIPVTATYSGLSNIAAGNGTIGMYLTSYSGLSTSPFNLTNLPYGTFIVSFVQNTSITVSNCPYAAIGSGVSLGFGGNSMSPYNDIGSIEGGLQGYPVNSMARSGDSYSLWNNDRSLRTQVFGQKGFTHFISEMCGNDIGTGLTVPQMVSLYSGIYQMAGQRGMKVTQATCVPRTFGYLGLPLFSQVNVTTQGTGFTASTPVVLTVAGGTLAGPATPATITCQVNASGQIVTGTASCVPTTIGYYSVTPTTTGNVPTGGTGTGTVVTLDTFGTNLDAYGQYYDGTNGFQPTVVTTASSAVTSSTTVTVPSLTNTGSPALAGTIGTGMYLSQCSYGGGAPYNTTVTAISGSGPYSITLSNPVTEAANATLAFVSTIRAFNDWMRCSPTTTLTAAGITAGIVDIASVVEYQSGLSYPWTGLWMPGVAPPATTITTDSEHYTSWQGQIAAGQLWASKVGTLFTLP